MHQPRSPRCLDVIAALEAIATEIAALEPELERWLVATVQEPAERERARRSAIQLRLQASRIAAVLDAATPAQSGPAPWHGQERRGPNRATNVARLPERSGEGQDDAPLRREDWEPF